MFFFGPHSFTPLTRWNKPPAHRPQHALTKTWLPLLHSCRGLWREVVEWNSWSLIIPKGRCRFPISGGFVEAPGGRGRWMNLEGCGGCWDFFVAVEIYSKSLSFGCFCWDLVIFDWCLFCVVLFFWCFCLVVLRLERIQENVGWETR